MSILEEAGNCWKELGAELQISESKLRNIETDHQRARDKASAVLEKWRDIKGRDATVGCLLDAFERSGQKRIADNLLGMEIYFYRPRKWYVMIYHNRYNMKTIAFISVRKLPVAGIASMSTRFGCSVIVAQKFI